MKVLTSALKHCTHTDVMHALHHPTRVMSEIRPDGSSRLLEVLIDETESEPVVFHADILRPAFGTLLNGW